MIGLKHLYFNYLGLVAVSSYRQKIYHFFDFFEQEGTSVSR